jgi:hypothetical protein
MQNNKCMVKASKHKNAHVVFSMVQRNFLSEGIVLTKGRLLYLSYASFDTRPIHHSTKYANA